MSCIMPTRDRRPFVRLTLELFARQSYVNRELLIIDDGADSVADLISGHPNVKHIRLNRRTSVGDKRNLGCETASGDIIVHWDDDDWYSATRLERQAHALMCNDGDVIALAMRYILELPLLRFWRCLPQTHSRLHFRDLCPGTIAYWRKLWTRSSRYSSVSCGEDVHFLRSLPSRTRMRRLPEEEHFVCVRHDMNTWTLSLDWRRDPRGWAAIEQPNFIPEQDYRAYRELHAAMAPALRSRA
jgi:glycosyltransferase involved in cell wall biosynthesis